MHVGADYEASDEVVVGIRAAVGFGGANGDTSFNFRDLGGFDEEGEGFAPEGDFRGAITLDPEWSWDLIARLGFLAHPRLLLYGALGAKQRHYEASLEFAEFTTRRVDTAEGTTYTLLFDENVEVRQDYTATGGTVGGGAEALLWDGRFSVGAEAFYTRYQDQKAFNTPVLTENEANTIISVGSEELLAEYRARDKLLVDQQDLFDVELRVFGSYRFNLFQ